MSNDAVKKLRAKNLKLGRKRKEYYVTDSEHIAIKAKIKSMRGENEQTTK
tara:strand:- start:27954 stop:28103 length:150 start_codon:yes stop_codon:yes gene_type:complete